MKSATIFVFMHGLSRVNVHLERIALKFGNVIWKIKRAKYKKDYTVQQNNGVLYRVRTVTVLDFLLRQLQYMCPKLVVKQERRGFTHFVLIMKRKNEAQFKYRLQRENYPFFFLRRRHCVIFCFVFFNLTSNQHRQTNALLPDAVPFQLCLP